MITVKQIRQLMAPLNERRVSKRGQGSRQLSYLEAWDVKAAMIRVFGFGGFSAEASEAKVLSVTPLEERKSQNDSTLITRYVVCVSVKMTLTIPAFGAVYSEYAAASQKGPDIGEVTDFAIKTAESDAFKRAAIYLGNQFGLGLYDNGSLADPVRVVLEENQAALIEQAKEEDQQRMADQARKQQDENAEGGAA